MIAGTGLRELGESLRILRPGEAAAIDDDTGDSSTMAANPLCGTVDNDVGTVTKGLAEETTSAEGVIDLISVR